MKKRHTFSNFTAGMDRRYIESSTKPNGFWDLFNCSVSPRNRIEKRPGVDKLVELTTDSVGLFPFNGRLWTVYRGTGTPTGQPQPPSGPEVWTIDLDHTQTSVSYLHYAGVILGGVYLSVEYEDLIPEDPN